MHQVIQDIKNGKISVVSVSPPLVRPGQVLIANTRFLVSAGSGKAGMEFAKKSLAGKGENGLGARLPESPKPRARKG